MYVCGPSAASVSHPRYGAPSWANNDRLRCPSWMAELNNGGSRWAAFMCVCAFTSELRVERASLSPAQP